jgi:alpha-N-acetylglucosaminidase
MAIADPDAVWVAQAWFLSGAPAMHPSTHTPWGWEQLEAFLLAPPHGKLVMLDLNAVANPVFNKTRSFLGVPFVWCAIENFGGRSGLYSTSLDWSVTLASSFSNPPTRVNSALPVWIGR